MQALQERIPDIEFVGVAGPHMAAAGCKALFKADELALIGLFEILGQLPRVLRIRRELLHQFLADPPDVFIGIDAPDFNLGLETKLKRRGIPTVHYVCPTVWAWRKGRTKAIRRAVDLLLSIFPFEQKLLEEAQIPARFVGHPLADRLPMEPDRRAARTVLGIDQDAEVVALLPGSRGTELNFLGPLFLQAAKLAWKRRPTLRFVVPLPNKRIYKMFAAMLEQAETKLPLQLVEGDSHTAMIAADRVLTASGTATLEAALLKRPMVVAYRFSALTYWILTKLVKVPHIAMANLIIGKRLVPEFLQDEATAENLSRALIELFEDREGAAEIVRTFQQLHRDMSLGADRTAAEAVLSLIRAQGEKA
jgi:lipid-A-disaccharide synthase